MADAGRILIIPRGDYNANSTYEKLDLVKYKGSSWLAKKNATGVEPSEGEYWQKLFYVDIANNLTTASEGYALDARQGKVLDDKITAVNSNLTSEPEYLNGCANAGETILRRRGNVVTFHIDITNPSGFNGDTQLLIPDGYRPLYNFNTAIWGAEGQWGNKIMGYVYISNNGYVMVFVGDNFKYAHGMYTYVV